MKSTRPVDNENWGVDITQYPVWQYVVNNAENSFDLAVFNDNENINNILSDFVFDIEKQFNLAAEKIVAEVNQEITKLKEKTLNEDELNKIKFYENLEIQIVLAKRSSQSQELDHDLENANKIYYYIQ